MGSSKLGLAIGLVVAAGACVAPRDASESSADAIGPALASAKNSDGVGGLARWRAVARALLPGMAARFEAAADGARRPVLGGATRPAVMILVPARADGAVRIEDAISKTAVAFTLRGATSAVLSLDAGYGVYPNGFAGADVIHRHHAGGVEDYVAFEARPESEELAYDVDVEHAAGLRLVENVLEFLDARGGPRVRVDPPTVTLANGSRIAATLSVDGCRVDTNPASPMGREPISAGARRCVVRVSWAGKGVTYPALVDPSWSATTSLPVRLELPAHASVQLPDAVCSAGGMGAGCVLVGGASDITSAVHVLFDPTTKTFATTGSTNFGRRLETATALDSGKVLVVGGEWDSSNPDSGRSAELWDPATGTFTLLAAQTGPIRWGGHRAIAIGGGKVLVTGGQETDFPPSGVSRSAEIFDESTQRFTSAGLLRVPRQEHEMTLLPSGQVLVSGGATPDPYEPMPLQQAELFDPTTRAFRPAGTDMIEPRRGHTATLLSSGKVLLVGGIATPAVARPTAELYDPEGDVFTAVTAAMTLSRAWHSATLLHPPGGEAVLIAGGVVYRGPPVGNRTEVFDVTTEQFRPAGSTAFTRSNHAAFALDTTSAVVLGGSVVLGENQDGVADYSYTQFSDSAEIFGFVESGGACEIGSGQCASGVCQDGVCCAGACSGVCKTCEKGSGTCVVAVNREDDSCYGICDPQGTCKRKNGEACEDNGSCLSGFCADGICCDTACGGACEACDNPASKGTCTVVEVGLPHGVRKCAEVEVDLCAGSCDGTARDACTFPDRTTACSVSCTGTSVVVGQCDSHGTCTGDGEQGCPGGYACLDATKCNTKCETDKDCASSHLCETATGQCIGKTVSAGEGCSVSTSATPPSTPIWTLVAFVVTAVLRTRQSKERVR